MKTIRKIISLAIIMIIILVVFINKDSISNLIINKFFYGKGEISYNAYYNNYNYLYVSNTDEYRAKSYQDLLNIFYTIINSGVGEFTFSCDSSYKECLEDVKTISNDNITLASINNFVHPYNSYQSISINISSYGAIKVKINFIYNDAQIEYINNYVNSFIKSNINDSMSDKDKIKAFHDYIINNTSYDSDTIDELGNISTENMSHTAYGLIKNGKAICGGYTDIMSIYLYILGFDNYRISTEKHVWNLVYVDGGWYHLDLTFDDPIASDNKPYLLYDYFLIKTDKLLQLNAKEHSFDQNIYLEALN